MENSFLKESLGIHWTLQPGDRVISRSNEWDDPLQTGTYLGRWCEKFPRVPRVLQDSDDTEYICFGKVLPWNQELYEHLLTLSNKEQWDYLCEKGLRTPP